MKKNSSFTAFEVHGLIFGKYGLLGYENGVMKFPTTNENDCPYNKGRYNAFEGGRILWQSGAAEAYALYGNIDVMYGRVSSEFGPLGYPTSDVKVASSTFFDSSYYSNFQNGKIKYRIKRDWMGKVTYKETWVVMENSIYSVDPLLKTKITSFSMHRSSWGNGKLVAVRGSGFKAGANFSVYVDQPTKGPKYLDGGYVKSDGTIDYKTDPIQTRECVFLNTFEVPSNSMSTIRIVDTNGNTALTTYSFLKCNW